MQNNLIQKSLRYFILAAILVLVTVLGRLHSIIKIYPAIDAFCPFGGLESLFVFLKYNMFLKRIALSSLILLIAVIVSAVVFRRSFCGNICPLGFLQEISAKIGRKIFGKRFVINRRADKIMRYIKYPVLVIVIAGTWLTMSLIFRPLDPWAAFHHIGSDELFSGYLIGFIILIASLAASFFFDRAFCKYLCPMGAFLAPLSKGGAYRIRNNRELCTSCGECDDACPMNITVSETENVTSAECINCMDCVSSCPAGSLSVSAWKNRRKAIKPAVLILVTFMIFAGIIGASTAAKAFVWKTPTGLTHETERLLWGPQRIRDDNSFNDIVMIYRINPNYIMQQYGITEEKLVLPFKEIGIDSSEVSGFVTGLYQEAGLDPKRIYAGGSCGGH